MHKGRLEAFSDGVIAIIITIMVLELKVPHIEHGPNDDIKNLLPLIPTFMSYVLSFVYVGIYWNNHHHMLQAAHSINGGIMWANMYLLFWLSMVPFATSWMGENHFTQWPVVVYGFVLIMNSVAYALLVIRLVKHHGKNSVLAKAIGSDFKGWLSTAIYAIGIVAAFFNPWIGLGAYVVVACIWFIPDRRIEKKIVAEEA